MSHDERRRRLERDRGRDLSVDERLRLEAEVLRSGEDWKARVPREHVDWLGGHGVYAGLEHAAQILENEGRLYPRKKLIMRWLLSRLIVGDWNEQEAVKLWDDWVAYAMGFRGHKAAMGFVQRSDLSRQVPGVSCDYLLAVFLGDLFLEQVRTYDAAEWLLPLPLVKPTRLDTDPWVGEAGLMRNPARLQNASADERRRQLERQAALGDQEAALRLHDEARRAPQTQREAWEQAEAHQPEWAAVIRIYDQMNRADGWCRSDVLHKDGSFKVRGAEVVIRNYYHAQGYAQSVARSNAWYSPDKQRRITFSRATVRRELATRNSSGKQIWVRDVKADGYGTLLGTIALANTLLKRARERTGLVAPATFPCAGCGRPAGAPGAFCGPGCQEEFEEGHPTGGPSSGICPDCLDELDPDGFHMGGVDCEGA